MLDEKSQAEVDRSVRVSQIIVVALAMGVVTFGVVLVFMAGDREVAEPGLLTFFGIGMAVVCSGMSLLVPRGVVLAQRRKIANGTWQMQGKQEGIPVTDAGKVAAVFLTKTIVGSALLEGPCFLVLYAFMTEGHVISPIVGAALLLGLLGHFPTSGRVTDWVTDQLRLVEEERQML